MPDKWERFRKEMGAERVDNFLAAFGLGPKYVPKEPRRHTCPRCGGANAYHKEVHPDTDMNDIVLFCPDCNFCDD